MYLHTIVSYFSYIALFITLDIYLQLIVTMDHSGQLTKKQKSCMKHKRKDKKKSLKEKNSGMEKKNVEKKFDKPFGKPKEQTKTLNDPAQFSENWKKLLSEVGQNTSVDKVCISGYNSLYLHIGLRSQL